MTGARRLRINLRRPRGQSVNGGGPRRIHLHDLYECQQIVRNTKSMRGDTCRIQKILHFRYQFFQPDRHANMFGASLVTRFAATIAPLLAI